VSLLVRNCSGRLVVVRWAALLVCRSSRRLMTVVAMAVV
jgi:hypothetical protein